jgi:hypothetical protein
LDIGFETGDEFAVGVDRASCSDSISATIFSISVNENGDENG